MDNTKSLVSMMTSRIAALHRQANKLSRMATFSTCARERRNLREESRVIKSKASMLQARLDKLTGLLPEQKDIVNG